MAEIDQLFVTNVYHGKLDEKSSPRLLKDLLTACKSVARDDTAGIRWCKENGYRGYTSYASLDDLPVRIPAFQELNNALQSHVDQFAKALHLDLQSKRLKLDSLWINVLKPGGMHSGHIHPNSVISGTCYVAVPPGSGSLKFEDPRLPFMMAAPARKTNAPRQFQPFVQFEPRPGSVLLFESWLRHEVQVNRGKEDRISISFNYA